ncbi:MAG: hypothetical protein BWY74_03276 [Firmicutes bacterium ADurb.Bin419]|nr:MAG: hypothetical protein BWY74_03276 [Firmicutes bacterium ADurb.Bin419]
MNKYTLRVDCLLAWLSDRKRPAPKPIIDHIIENPNIKPKRYRNEQK